MEARWCCRLVAVVLGSGAVAMGTSGCGGGAAKDSMSGGNGGTTAAAGAAGAGGRSPGIGGASGAGGSPSGGAGPAGGAGGRGGTGGAAAGGAGGVSAGGAGGGGRGGGSGGTPAMDAGPADAPRAATDAGLDRVAAGPVQRLLYVAGSGTQGAPGTIDVFDINQNHRLVRRIAGPLYGNPDKGPTGMAANAATARLYVTEYPTLTAWDLITEKVLWTKRNPECGDFDRLTITNDGKTIYVPCHSNGRVWVVNAATGDGIKFITFPNRPHNSFTGEAGRYVYLAASRNPFMLLADPATHEVVKMVGPFNALGVRPFSVNKSETLVFVNLVALLGFAVGDVATGKMIHEIKQTVPPERAMYPQAQAPRHGADPVYFTLSHGIAVRPPDSKEVWFVDDLWGYLYVYDITVMPPKHLANVPLFTKIDQPWTNTNARWVTFSMDGKYVYPANGLVVDAEKRMLLPDKITGSEKMIEVQWQGGVPIAVSGQMGGVYPR